MTMLGPKPSHESSDSTPKWNQLLENALIKQDIVHRVIERTGLPRNKAEAAVDTIFESLKKALAAGERIELRGFGVFNVRPRKTGIGRNPRTGAEVTITPGKAVRFKPGKDLHVLESDSKSTSSTEPGETT